MPRAAGGGAVKSDKLSVWRTCPFCALEMSKPACSVERLIPRHLPLAVTSQPAQTDKLCGIGLQTLLGGVFLRKTPQFCEEQVGRFFASAERFAKVLRKTLLFCDRICESDSSPFV